MRHFTTILTVCILSFTLMGFSDFIDYWVVKINGKQVYNSNDDKKYDQVFNYEIDKSSLSALDSLDVEYFTDTPCGCIYNYFVTEYSDKDGGIEILGTILKEQKTFLTKSYKLSLLDLFNVGNTNTVKAIYFYRQDHPIPKELCRIKFK